ncbi:MAG TPA: hypothetical protein VLS89_03085 [Candidatus Nanopelagicales bacterium]|nr:hypothetical protein [Candidatus Nanopelagicales bacterium]
MPAKPFRLGARALPDAADPNPFTVTGFAGNPFPEPGLDTGALYVAHMSEQVKALDAWVNDVEDATDLKRAASGPVRPIAVRGSIGVGKTHLLKTLERDLSTRSLTAVIRKNLPDEGMDRLLLATLLLGSLPRGDEELDLPPVPSALPLLDRIVVASRSSGRGRHLREVLFGLTGSPIAPPLLRVLDESDRAREAELRAWFARWLLRGHTTPIQRSKLGLAKPLEGEGQAIRAVADLMRAARATRQVQRWFVLIDQLEDLWRAGVISPGRRARFLTDLRSLVDLGLEGAPIAVLLAWNTEITTGEDKLETEYQALWRRLGDPLELPGIEVKDIWPFAKEYLDNAQRLPEKGGQALRKQFREELEQSTGMVVNALREDSRARLGPQRFATYRVLHHWREAASMVARKLNSRDVTEVRE